MVAPENVSSLMAGNAIQFPDKNHHAIRLPRSAANVEMVSLKSDKNVMMEMVTIMMVAANFANYKTLINFTVQIIFTF